MEIAAGESALQVAEKIGPGLARVAIAARVNGNLQDLTRPLGENCELAIITKRDPEALEILRHSTAHATAQAVQELFPKTRIAQGPVIENGFYYDFDREEPFTAKELASIEARVKEIRKNIHRKFSSEEKNRVVLEGLHGKCSIVLPLHILSV
jgi:threonyl-tRNA synthetase